MKHITLVALVVALCPASFCPTAVHAAPSVDSGIQHRPSQKAPYMPGAKSKPAPLAEPMPGAKKPISPRSQRSKPEKGDSDYTSKMSAAQLRAEIGLLTRNYEHMRNQVLSLTVERTRMQNQIQTQQTEIAHLKVENAKLAKAKH